MMRKVEFGKVWEINTVDELVEAWETLKENDFCARMCDSYRRECEERDEIYHQKMMIVKQAHEKGLV